MTRDVWLDLRGADAARLLAELPPEIPLTGIVLDAGQPQPPSVRNLHLAAYCTSPDDVARAAWAGTIVSPDEATLKEARGADRETALWAMVDDDRALREVCARGAGRSTIFVEFTDETNIPLELLLATFHGTGTKVLKYVRSIDEAKVAFGTLENGCHGIVVARDAGALLAPLEQWQRGAAWSPLPLQPAIVTEIAPADMGARVCVDTVEMLARDEGMIVGSTAFGGLCVCAEVHPLPYMKLRPFRVNAGALHSYVACPDDRTAYLSELESGERVLVASTAGRVRPVTVGRAKMEYRPLLRVSAEHDGKRISAILQNDWHVRVFDHAGRARSITTLRPGDRLLASCLRAARHVGIAVTEQLQET